jgi:2-polyprenyl-3-methyl-5-hydroxy-6-metoxy-1,4-benzoquinol methylase
MSLDLYAKIEPLIGFYDEYDELHHYYISLLKKYNATNVLDVGCGNGSMLQKLKDAKIDALGIDLSSKMIEIAKSKGVNAECINIKDIKQKYNAIVAIGDVLNYLDKNTLKEFLVSVESILEDGGVFLADINTMHGFINVADGVMVQEAEDMFLSVEANFEKNILSTHFTLFEKDSVTKLYSKSSSIINQYYYKSNDIKKATKLKHIRSDKISMFSTEADKELLIFQKVQ